MADIEDHFNIDGNRNFSIRNVLNARPHTIKKKKARLADSTKV
jgi:hypothetical protein